MNYLLVEHENNNELKLSSITPAQFKANCNLPVKVTSVGRSLVEGVLMGQRGWQHVTPSNINPHMA